MTAVADEAANDGTGGEKEGIASRAGKNSCSPHNRVLRHELTLEHNKHANTQGNGSRVRDKWS